MSWNINLVAEWILLISTQAKFFVLLAYFLNISKNMFIITFSKVKFLLLCAFTDI